VAPLGFCLSTENLHVGLFGVVVVPSALDEIAQVWHIFFDRGAPQIRAVFKYAQHIVHVKERARSFRFDQDDGFVVGDAYAELEEDVGVVFGEIGNDEISVDEVVDDRGLYDVAALTVRGLDLEILRGRCDDGVGGLTIFGAVEKLGLRLKLGKLPMPVMVIDHMERPAPN